MSEKLDKQLIAAVRRGSIKTIRILLLVGADVHAMDDLALILSADIGHLEVVELLLNAGADIHADNDRALQQASAHGHHDIVDLLLKSGSDVHSNNDVALREAVRRGQREVVDLLLKAGADVHAWDDSALRLAARAGHTEVVDLLLKYGADVHVHNGWALRWAARSGHVAVVGSLLTSGADITTLFQPRLLSQQTLTSITKQYASTAYRGFDAVMMLPPTPRMGVLLHLHPELKPKQIREDIAMMQALGLDVAQMAEMWQARHVACNLGIQDEATCAFRLVNQVKQHAILAENTP